MDEAWNQKLRIVDQELEHKMTRTNLRVAHRDGEERVRSVLASQDIAGGEEDEVGFGSVVHGGFGGWAQTAEEAEVEPMTWLRWFGVLQRWRNDDED